MKIKTSELSGEQLDWAVAKCEGKEVRFECGVLFLTTPNITYGDPYRPAEDWEYGGPIIERENMGVKPNIGYEKWSAQVWRNSSPISTYGPTPLIAAMRCYVASKLGEEVEVSDGTT